MYMKYENRTKPPPSPEILLPGPMNNQPSHEMKCKSMITIYYIPSVVKDLKNCSISSIFFVGSIIAIATAAA